MWDNIVLEIYNLRWLISAYVIAIVVACFLFWLGTSGFAWTKTKIRIFGVLYDLSEKSKAAATFAFGRYIFIIVSTVMCSYTGIYHMAVLLIFSLTICILEVDFKNIFGDIAVYIAVYAIMMLESIMYKYYIQVENSAVIMVMTVMLGIFVSLYSTYHLIVSYDRILKKEMEAKGFYLNA